MKMPSKGMLIVFTESVVQRNQILSSEFPQKSLPLRK